MSNNGLQLGWGISATSYATSMFYRDIDQLNPGHHYVASFNLNAIKTFLGEAAVLQFAIGGRTMMRVVIRRDDAGKHRLHVRNAADLSTLPSAGIPLQQGTATPVRVLLDSSTTSVEVGPNTSTLLSGGDSQQSTNGLWFGAYRQPYNVGSEPSPMAEFSATFTNFRFDDCGP
jgi:hypothetical protein